MTDAELVHRFIENGLTLADDIPCRGKLCGNCTFKILPNKAASHCGLVNHFGVSTTRLPKAQKLLPALMPIDIFPELYI